MAGVDSTTVKKKAQLNARQRTSQTDVNEFQDQAQEMDALNVHELVASDSSVVRGLEISFSSGYDFLVGVGSGLWKGEVLRQTSNATVTLDENTDPNARIDLIEINGVSEVDSDSASKTLLSSITRTSVTGEAVGTGDASTKPWDLANAGVDLSTLKVYLGGVLSGGWSYSPETGTGSVDQIIFHDAPGSSVAITADYDYLSGGVEAGATVNTRKSLSPTFNVVKGTPAASPSVPSATSNAVKVGTIEVPGSWTGGAGYSIAHSVRKYMVHPDKVTNNRSTFTASDVRSGKITNAIRNIHQALEGFRLVWVSTTSFKITPGWGVSLGQSFYSSEDIEETGVSLGSAGWNYVYLSLTVGEAGVEPTISISSTGPTSERMINSSSANDVYIGAIYWTGSAIRKFFSRGDWVFWDTAVSFSLTVPQVTALDLDVTTACPVTGRTLEARLSSSLSSSGSDGTVDVVAKSQMAANIADPALRSFSLQSSTSLAVLNENNGKLIAEESSSTRYVNYTTATAGTTSSPAATLYILGYLDDYRTLDVSGSAMFY